MRRAAAAVALALCAACTSGPGGPAPAPSSPEPTASATTSSAVPSPSIAPAAHRDAIGVAFTLVRTTGDEVRVNAVEARDPAEVSGRNPAPGTRFVAVRLELTNIGRSRWDERPHDASRLRAGETLYAPLPGEPIRPGLGPSVRVAEGGFARGWLTFEVPLHSRPVFRFAPDAGRSPDVAEWSLGG